MDMYSTPVHVRPVEAQLRGIQTPADLQPTLYATYRFPCETPPARLGGRMRLCIGLGLLAKRRSNTIQWFRLENWYEGMALFNRKHGANVSKYCIPRSEYQRQKEQVAPDQALMFCSCTSLADLTGTHQLATGWTLRTATSVKLRLTHGAQSLARPGPGSFLSSRHQFSILVQSLVLDACIDITPRFKSRTHALRCILTSLRFSRMILQLSASAAGLVVTGTSCHGNLRAHPQR